MTAEGLGKRHEKTGNGQNVGKNDLEIPYGLKLRFNALRSRYHPFAKFRHSGNLKSHDCSPENCPGASPHNETLAEERINGFYIRDNYEDESALLALSLVCIEIFPKIIT